MEKLLNGILLLFFCTGCGIEVQDKNQNNNDTHPQVKTSVANYLPAELLTVTPQGAEPQRYNLIFAWPSVEGTVLISEGNTVLTEAAGTQENFVLPGLYSRQEHQFTIQHKNPEGKVLQTIQRTVQIPLDLVIVTSELNQNTSYKAHRVFFQENAVLTIGPHALLIEADELHSANGTVQSFHVGARAATDPNAIVAGRSGGDIQVKARVGRGKLNFILRGENGANGAAGFIAIANCRGQRGGLGGDSSALTIQIKDATTIQIPYTSEAGKPGVDGAILKPNESPTDSAPACSSLRSFYDASSPRAKDGAIRPVKIN